MKVAVVGCAHGELNRVYDDIAAAEERDGITIELVIICGDFQAVRNEYDLECMAVPKKFRALGDFHEYYWGTRKASKLTLVIGGNHEASSYMITLPYGGWIAPNIYYMGYSSVVRYRGLRIGGLSGIHKAHDADHGHYEHCPLDNNTMRSCYHVRNLEIHRLLRMKSPIPDDQALDIMISHDWPINIDKCGNTNQLLKMKPFFRQEVQQNRLGNPMLGPLVGNLKPRHWFSAHLHVRFAATVIHNQNAPVQSQIKTHFLALDKILPNRKYMEILDIEPRQPVDATSASTGLEYDPTWIAVLRATNKFMSADKFPKVLAPKPWIVADPIPERDLEQVMQLADGNLAVPDNFALVEPAIDPEMDSDPRRVFNYVNPQTELFCETFELKDPMRIILDRSHTSAPSSSFSRTGDFGEKHSTGSVTFKDSNLHQEQGLDDSGETVATRRSEINENIATPKRQRTNEEATSSDRKSPIVDDSGLFFIDTRGSDPFDNSFYPPHREPVTNPEPLVDSGLFSFPADDDGPQVLTNIRDSNLTNITPTTSPVPDINIIMPSSEMDPPPRSEADLRNELESNMRINEYNDTFEPDVDLNDSFTAVATKQETQLSNGIQPFVPSASANKSSSSLHPKSKQLRELEEELRELKEEEAQHANGSPNVVVYTVPAAGTSSAEKVKLKSDLTKANIRQLRKWNEKYLPNKAASNEPLKLLSVAEYEVIMAERGVKP